MVTESENSARELYDLEIVSMIVLKGSSLLNYQEQEDNNYDNEVKTQKTE